MLGDREWMNLTQGKLSFLEKLQLIQKVMLPASLNFIHAKMGTYAQDSDLVLKNIQIPDTALIKDALFELEKTDSKIIFQHSWRCYFWGVAIAKYKKWQFDEEVFLISSLMHDVGLAKSQAEFSYCQCFTFESALRAEQLCQQHDFPQDKTQRIADAICLHMNGYLNENDHNICKEILLLQQATAYDVVGTQQNLISEKFYLDVLNHYPKDNFKVSFKELIQQEIKRHPYGRTAFLSPLGLKLMIHLNNK